MLLLENGVEGGLERMGMKGEGKGKGVDGSGGIWC